MLRRLVRSRLALPMLAVGLTQLANASPALAQQEDERVALTFLRELRERGLPDVAIDYIARLKTDLSATSSLKATLDFEHARALIDSAGRSSDPERTKELLEEARNKIEAFIKADPNRPEATEAQVELAHLFFERGRIASILASTEAKTPAEKDQRLSEARASFKQARESYTRAFETLNAAYGKFPKFIEDGDPRKAQRDRIHGSTLQAELQKTVCDYEEAQTYPADSKPRGELLDKARVAFEDIYRRHRTQLAGFSARMWQGKCHEEKGELGPALGIYNELLDHTDPRLAGLQKKVAYFQIIVHAKRGEHALAADLANAWLGRFRERRTLDAVGVQFELAKNILAQLGDAEPAQKNLAIKKATDALAEVVRVYSPLKADALKLLQQYRPKSAVSAASIGSLNYDECLAEANSAIDLQEYDKAIAYLKAAIRKVDATRDPAKANKPRYTLAFCYYMTKRPAEAAVIAEHLARRYPSGEWSGKASDIGIAALIDAYNKPGENRQADPRDLLRLIDLARHAAATWPDTDQGDSARMILGQIDMGQGKYAQAVASFESVRKNSSRWVDAQTLAGGARWKLANLSREKSEGDSKAFDEEVRKAEDLLTSALRMRKESNTPITDLGYVGNAVDLATVYVETGKAQQALDMLAPIARDLGKESQSPAQKSAYTNVVSGVLRSHVALGQVNQAIADMQLLEKSGGGGAGQAKLYNDLSKLLERELEGLKARGDTKGLERTRVAFGRFLTALSASKSGQSPVMLMAAGENLLKIGQPKEANQVFDRFLEIYGSDPKFLEQPESKGRLLRVRLKKVAALRDQGQFADAAKMLDELFKTDGRYIETQMEKGYLLSAQAAGKAQVTWTQAYNYWRNLAIRLGGGAGPKRQEYYECWYQAALTLDAQKKPDLARQTLNAIKRLTPAVGSPEMKTKYDQLLARLGPAK